MGIQNIRILINEPQPTFQQTAHQIQVAHLEALAADHRRGKHPDGLKRRDCPLCVAGK